MKVGIEAWLQRGVFPEGKIALLSHQAALLTTGEAAAQALRRVFGERLVALFGPEHGYFGAAVAGEKTFTVTHPLWQIPVHSLYGEHRKPTPEMLQGIDFMIVDLQDLGVRCYTYMATLKLMLEACAEAGIPCLVCDRPVPFHGRACGPIATKERLSFVAPCEVPFVHGMLPTEIAAFLQLPFEAAHIEGSWDFLHPINAPEFIPPSPAIRSRETAMLYPATVLAEAFPAVDILRTAPWAFRVVVAPWMDSETVIAALEAEGVPGVTFHDFTQSEACRGVRLHLADAERYGPWLTAKVLFRTLYRLYPTELMHEARLDWLEKLLAVASPLDLLEI